MSLLPFDVAERRAIADGPLSALSDALRVELEPLVGGPLVIPEHKARLTRQGGRCEDDGTLLEFSPWLPHEHRCRQCGRVYTGQVHHDWWAMGAQLWTAERAAQSAALNLLRGDEAAGTIALRILAELGDRYTSWPNSDNVLGPSRPFFSTYLESIWLLNLCHAVALLEQSSLGDSDRNTLSRVRDQLIAPSRNLIASYNEGRSNRQVWNEVAILSASRVLGDERTIERRLNSPTGFHHLIATGLLDDGTWYEGENYHLFAHRGLWYGVQVLRAIGQPLNEALDARYRAGFVTPFLGVLPDDTLPSRRDSQYAVSIRQWRFAEWCELGIAHAAHRDGSRAPVDPRLTGTLQRLYNPSPNDELEHQQRHPFSTADAERNERAGLLTRADLSWRALLMANAVLPAAADWSPGSVCLPSQGLAVIRREHGQMYVALEGGHTGGGHGHPDRLSLTLQRGNERWLEDPGTGSYVEQKLHWYRSTLAHAAPVIDGASQDAVPAELLAFEDRGWAGWIKKRVRNMKPGVNVDRTIVVCEGYLIDVLEWDADREVQVDLPVGRHLVCMAQKWERADPGGAGGLEDGFDFLIDAEVDRGRRSISDTIIPEGEFEDREEFAALLESMRGKTGHVAVVFHDADWSTSASYGGSHRFEMWKATAPGAPGRPREQLYWMRSRATRGQLYGVWRWGGVNGSSMSFPPLRISVNPDGTEAIHSPSETGWHIDLKCGDATSSIDLGFLTPHNSAPADTSEKAERAADALPVALEPAAIAIPHAPASVAFELAEQHYLQTEQAWADAGAPHATVELSADDEHLLIVVVAQTGAPTIPPHDSENKLDNERRDVNADGVQIHVGAETGQPWTAAWLAVPAPDSAPQSRVSPLVPHSPEISSTWHAVPDGWAMSLRIPKHALPLATNGTFLMEVIVNERPKHRARRRGQLVLSGGGGFAYLRGDRTDSTPAFTFRIINR